MATEGGDSAWSDRAHDESRMLVPYLRKGVHLYGAEYVYAVLRSLQDAIELGEADMLSSDERHSELSRAKDAVDRAVKDVALLERVKE